MAVANFHGLPKTLCVTLDELVNNEEVIQWSINSNNSVTSVVIRFPQAGHVGEVSVSWRKSPAQQRRDRARSTNFVSQQYDVTHNVSTDISHDNMDQGNVDFLNGRSGEGNCKNTSYTRTPTSAPFESQLEPSKVLTPQTGETDIQGELLDKGVCTNANTNILCEMDNMSPGNSNCDHHPSVAEHLVSENDSQSNKHVPDKMKLTGTKDDFAKVVLDWRYHRTNLYMRGLIKDGKITEMDLGTDGPLTVMEKDVANKEYQDMYAFIDRQKDCGWEHFLWQDTIDTIIKLWIDYVYELDDIT